MPPHDVLEELFSTASATRIRGGEGSYLGRDEALQHVDALHDDEGLQQLHLELQTLGAEAVELGEGGREECP